MMTPNGARAKVIAIMEPKQPWEELDPGLIEFGARLLIAYERALLNLKPVPTMLEFELLHPEMTPDHLGLLPYMLDADSLMPARDQFDANYQHGGGWRAFKGHTLNADNSLSYPGDPDSIPLAQARLRDELIVVYRHAFVAIIQPDRSFEVCRVD